ncbi:MAG: hypothetical protein QM820_05615 [Minicystis sp.]
MSNQQGGPPRAGFGPGQTVLDPSLTGEPPPAGPSPNTVRDPAAGFGSPAPPPYGASPYAPAAPYGAPAAPYGAPYAPDAARPIAIPPPPPPARGRGRGRSQGPSLVIIGVVAFFVIGGGVTAFALFKTPSDDDKPAPTVDVPASVTVPPDVPDAGVSANPPAPTDPPPAPTPTPYRPIPRAPVRPPGPRSPTTPRTPVPRYPGAPGPRRPPK